MKAVSTCIDEPENAVTAYSPLMIGQDALDRADNVGGRDSRRAREQDGADGMILEVHLIFAGDHDDGRAFERWELPNLGDQVEAAHIRELQVKQNQIRPVMLDQGQPFLRAVSAIDLVWIAGIG